MRFLNFILLLLIAALLGGIYGAIFDQLAYSVSNEFFTKMRFVEYGIQGDVVERWEVAKIGFKKTWVVGLSLGVFLSLTGLLHSNTKKMFNITVQCYTIVLTTALLFALLALMMAEAPQDNVVAVEVVDKEAFGKVLTMINYTYVGGIIGMFLGMAWQVFKTRTKSLK